MNETLSQANVMAALQDLSDEINSSDQSDISRWVHSIEDLVRQNIHVFLANGIFERIIAGEHTALPSTNGKYILLFNDRNVSLAVVRYKKPSKDILWSSEHFAQTAITAAGCSADYYEIPNNVAEDRFQTGFQLPTANSVRITRGTTVVKMPRTIFDLSQLDGDAADFVRLSLAPQGSFEWAFSRQDGRATSITTTKYGESNMLGILDLLAQAGNAHSADLLEKLCEHHLHFVRWHALRSLLELNLNRGIAILQLAKGDRHPDVASAATATLKNIAEKEQSGLLENVK